jgi:1-aminocyclopropane-1-carboxylate deaminase/D-cysteine desulfhydrase-like pyridoxal-dependent ACC family enzyme
MGSSHASTDMTLALFETLPCTQTIPHTRLAQLPTPVEHLVDLGVEVGVESLFVKRDDQSGTAYGGNKVRKLEFLLGEAVAEGYDEVWTVGAIGSHHALATCIYARELGLTPSVLHFPQPVTDHVLDNLRAISTTQPKLKLASHKAQLPVEVGKAKVRDWLSRSNDVYYIPGGGSSPVGVLGYVNAAFELAAQVDDGELPEPDYIFVAAGTCGTLAGLTLGCRMAGLATQVVGVRVVDKILANATLTARLANKTGDILAEHGVEDVPRISRSEVLVLDDYFGPDYGVPTEEGLDAMDVAGEAAELKLEPTYTAKAFAGLVDVRERFGLADKHVLYWHTLSSANLGDRIARADVERDLPDAYQRFFEEAP